MASPSSSSLSRDQANLSLHSLLRRVNFQLSTASAQSPRVPSEGDIVPKILNADSDFYYPRMMVRYLEGDETLTQEHYYYLYYGYAYDDSYDAHKPLPGETVMAEVFSAAGDKPTREDALRLIEAGRENMLVDPFSPSNVNMMTWAYEAAGDSLNARISADRYRKIVAAIESSGTGLRENSPWHILRFSHADDLVAARGLQIVNRQVRTLDVEYLQLAPNKERVKGYFFDFSRVYWKPYSGERKKRQHRWEFNGLPI